jgi:hypothetical protein
LRERKKKRERKRERERESKRERERNDHGDPRDELLHYHVEDIVRTKGDGRNLETSFHDLGT